MIGLFASPRTPKIAFGVPDLDSAVKAHPKSLFLGDFPLSFSEAPPSARL